jgi:hypothetical protein
MSLQLTRLEGSATALTIERHKEGLRKKACAEKHFSSLAGECAEIVKPMREIEHKSA